MDGNTKSRTAVLVRQAHHEPRFPIPFALSLSKCERTVLLPNRLSPYLNSVLAGFGALCLISLSFFACRSDPRVVVSTKGGKEYAARVEIADTPSKREMGLQYRTDLADDQGMLFLFPTETVLTFWMKNIFFNV